MHYLSSSFRSHGPYFFDTLEKIGNLMLVSWLVFLFRYPWQDARVREKGTEVIVKHILLKCLVKNTMDILDGLG